MFILDGLVGLFSRRRIIMCKEMLDILFFTGLAWYCLASFRSGGLSIVR